MSTESQEFESAQQGDRRTDLRYPAALTVQMISSETVPINARTSGLSIGGMHIECDRQLAQLMVPPAVTEDNGPGRQFTARISAKTNGNTAKTITIVTGAIGITAVDDDVYRVALRFEHYYGKSKQVLQEFLDSLE